MACFYGNLDALQNGLFKLEIWQGEEEGTVASDGEEEEGSEEGSNAEEPNEAGDREVLVHVLCCFALFVCLTLLASFFLPSHLSFKNMYIHVYI